MNQTNNPELINTSSETTDQLWLARLRNLIIAREFDDPKENQSARILFLLATVTIAGSILGLVWSLFATFLGTADPGLTVGQLYGHLTLIIIGLVVIIALRRGSIRVAGWVILLSLTFIITGTSLSIDAVKSPNYVLLFLIPVSAGVILGQREGAIFSTLSILAAGLKTYVQYIHYPELVDLSKPITFSSVVLLITLVMNANTRAFEKVISSLRATAESLKRSNIEIEQSRASLEEVVTERTRDLKRRTKYLEASAIVAHDATSILDPQELLEYAVSLISEHFSFYHVGLFLVDEENQWAILRAASSDGGKRMIARDHRLMVGKQGIVGFVTGIGQARISQDIELDLIHSVAPELPETRSEMALPLKARNQIIGAIDIQDIHENAFSEGDANILQTLANQIALAIDNAKLYQQAQANVQEIEKLLGEAGMQSWKDTYLSRNLPAYKFNTSEGSNVQQFDNEQFSSQEDTDKIEIPISVRGQTIGSIDIIRGEKDEWSEDEAHILETISEQLGVAIDSARLFQETQTRAITERIISELSSEIRETLDINTILKTTANRVRHTLNLPEVTIRLADPSDPTNTNGSDSDDDE
jgi:GAF domain-containing protein